MAEIILPPEEEQEETPQVPELNVDKPTDNSKVITIEFEAKKTNKVSTKDTNQQLYTTDTDAWFEFKETSLEGANGTYSVVFRNRHDGSIFQRTGDVVNGVAYYKIPHQEIRHAGKWRGQLVYTLSNGDTTAREFGYDVKGHILDGKDVREIVVEDFETLMSQLNSMKDNAELELADLVNTAERNELERQQFYESLVEDINDLQENYQELLDTGVLQTNINEKLEELEEEYAPKLTEVAAQLAQKDNSANASHALLFPGVQDNQVTHPSVLWMGFGGWNGYRYWMAHTPFYYADEATENPWVYVSTDGFNWEQPEGIDNPLATTPNKSNMHHSDTELVYNDDLNRLEVWFRRTEIRELPTRDIILRRTSTDGVNWTPEEVLYTDSDTVSTMSPVVKYVNGQYKIWVVNWALKVIEYFESVTGNNWEKIRDIDFPENDLNVDVWHMDIHMTDNHLELYYNTGYGYPVAQHLMYSKSTDNRTFSKAVSIMETSGLGFDDRFLYRPSIVDVPNDISGNLERRMYYGAVNKSNAWKIGVTFGNPEEPTIFNGDFSRRNYHTDLSLNGTLIDNGTGKITHYNNHRIRATTYGVTDSELLFYTDKIIPELHFRKNSSVYGKMKLGELILHQENTQNPLAISQFGNTLGLPASSGVSIGGTTRYGRNDIKFTKYGIGDLHIQPEINGTNEDKVVITQYAGSGGMHLGLKVGFIELVNPSMPDKTFKLTIGNDGKLKLNGNDV